MHEIQLQENRIESEERWFGLNLLSPNEDTYYELKKNSFVAHIDELDEEEEE